MTPRSTSRRPELRIVGTATFPAVGFSSFIADHTSMGTGALVAPTGSSRRRSTGPSSARTRT